MGVPNGYTSAQVVQAVPTGIQSALVCVKAETAFSAVSNVTVDNIFTSTYTNYKIVIEYQSSTTNDSVFQLRASGTASTTGYYRQRLIAQTTSTYASKVDNQSSLDLMNHTDGAFLGFVDLTLYSPQLAQDTLFQAFVNSPTGPSVGYDTMYAGYKFGAHDVATAYDGFIISCSTGTITGKYTIYGYAKTV